MSTNEEMQLIEAVREFAENNLNDPEYLEKFSPEMWEKIADFGLLGITVDEKYGGLGESYRTAAAKPNRAPTLLAWSQGQKKQMTVIYLTVARLLSLTDQLRTSLLFLRVQEKEITKASQPLLWKRSSRA